MHHSLYSAGPHGNNVKMLEAGIPALLRQHHIDVVFAGHDHLYERGFGAGLRYVITGGGGAPLYEIRNKTPETRFVEAARHHLEVAVSSDAVEIIARRVNGTVMETCGFAAGSTDWSCDNNAGAATTAATVGTGVASGLRISAASAGAPLGSGADHPNAVPKSSCNCSVLAAQSRATSAAALAAVAGMLCALVVRRRRYQRVVYK
jgi:acid phosphatase type 7